MAVSESARMAEMLKLSDERRAGIIEATAQAWQHGPQASAKACLAATVAALRAEADWLTTNKVKGHVTQAQTIRAGAGRVAAYEMKMSDASTVTGSPVPIPAPDGPEIVDLPNGGRIYPAGVPPFEGPDMNLLDNSQAARCTEGIHPEVSLSTLKDGATWCAACQTIVAPPPTAGPFGNPAPIVLNPTDVQTYPVPASTGTWAQDVPIGTQVTVGGIDFTKIGTDPFKAPAPGFNGMLGASDALSYLSGVTDTYTPETPMTAPTTPVPDPFVNPTGAPNNKDSRPDTRKVMPYMEVRGLMLQLEPAGRQSVSAIESRQNCGMKLGFDRLSRRGLIAPARPQWALIGGKAFHTLIELMEKWVWSTNRNAPGTASLTVFTPELIPQHWTTALDRARDEALTGTSFTVDDIRPSNRGLEGYDWWRVEGAEMVNRYVAVHTGSDYTSKFRLASFDGGLTPALEVEYLVNTNPLAGSLLPGGAPTGSGIELQGFMDRIDVAVDGSCYVIRDFKSGRSKGSQFQGANYIHAARRTLPIPPETPILFSNFDARTGGYLDPRQLDLTITWEEVVARAEEAETANAARIYPASPSSFCGGCGHAAICPGKVA